MSDRRFYEQLTQAESAQIHAQLREATTLSAARHLSSMILREHPALSVAITLQQPHWRVRPTSCRWGFSSLRDVLAPPADKTRAGRVNHEHEPKLYISARLETALAEVEAREGTHYHAIAFMSQGQSPVRLAVVGEHHHVLRKDFLASFGYDPNETIKEGLRSQGDIRATRIAFADAMMADILSDPDARAKEYIPSRGLADALVYHARAEGILFPSVRHDHGQNISIDPRAASRSLKVVASTVLRVDKVWPKGYFSLSTTATYSLDHDSETFRPIETAQHGNAFFNLTEAEAERLGLGSRASNERG